MTRQEWAGQVELLRQRVQAFAESGDPLDAGLTLSEIQAALEELQVADEELRQQHDEIFAARQTAEAQRQRYQDLFEFAPDAYLVTDPSGTIWEANRAAAGLLDIEAKYLIRKPLILFVVESGRSEFRKELTRLRYEDGVRNWEVRLQTRAGRPFEGEVSVAAVRVPGGALFGFRWLLRDVSERKRAEEQTRALNTALRETVGRYAEQVEANRRKDEFLAVLAHELRNPLATVFQALALLKLSGGNAAGAARAFGLMERQAHSLNRLIDDLLDVTRLAHGKMELRRERVELARALTQAAETARPAVERRGLHLNISLPPEPVWLDADPVRLGQVLDNLLSNAVRYTEPGGRIHLAAERDGGEAVVTVRDTGIGMTPEMLARAFDLFARAETSGARAREGLGLGLTIVRRIIELHGGTVQALSEGPGQGSTFVVRLPALAGPPAEPPEPRHDRNGHADRPARVLVVDDNADARDSLAILLKAWGHEVETAADGPAALEAARTRAPDVVLLDLGLPGMDGLEVARRLRAGPNGCGARLIALTGYGQDSDRRRTREAGFDVHLTKPVEIEYLRKLLGGKQPV